MCIIAPDMANRIGNPNDLHKPMEMSTVVPIQSLQRSSRKWTILGRVLAKTDLRPDKRKANGEAILFFYFDVLDKFSGQIRIACFEDDVARFMILFKLITFL